MTTRNCVLPLKPKHLILMKQRLLTLLTAILLTSCAGVNIPKTDIASGASHPKYIYIRPFAIQYASFKSCYDPRGEVAILKSLAPITFANILQEELCKIAPAMVIKNDETPKMGWLVEGEFEYVRATPPSHVVMHVRIIDVSDSAVAETSKDSEKSAKSTHGRIVYEFDVKGGSYGNPFGTVYDPGLSYGVPFDFRNAAERIMIQLSVDPYRYGYRSTPTI